MKRIWESLKTVTRTLYKDEGGWVVAAALVASVLVSAYGAYSQKKAQDQQREDMKKLKAKSARDMMPEAQRKLFDARMEASLANIPTTMNIRYGDTVLTRANPDADRALKTAAGAYQGFSSGQQIAPLQPNPYTTAASAMMAQAPEWYKAYKSDQPATFRPTWGASVGTTGTFVENDRML